MSGASERANGRASGPVLQSVFLAVFDHSAGVKGEGVEEWRIGDERERGFRTINGPRTHSWFLDCSLLLSLL